MTKIFTAAGLTGRTRRHIRQYETPRFAAHAETGADFLAMRRAAAADGFDLRPFSSFRDIKTQTRIWNRKYQGARPVYDQSGAPIDISGFDDRGKIWAILGWSALPGGSRHHWGTEIDVVDGAVVDRGHPVDLLPYETAPGGPFRALHDWLDAHIADFGFFRPYDAYRGGMFAEPWHLSHRSTAAEALATLTEGMIADAVSAADIAGKDAVLALLPEIFARHIAIDAAGDGGL